MELERKRQKFREWILFGILSFEKKNAKGRKIRNNALLK